MGQSRLPRHSCLSGERSTRLHPSSVARIRSRARASAGATLTLANSTPVDPQRASPQRTLQYPEMLLVSPSTNMPQLWLHDPVWTLRHSTSYPPTLALTEKLSAASFVEPSAKIDPVWDPCGHTSPACVWVMITSSATEYRASPSGAAIRLSPHPKAAATAKSIISSRTPHHRFHVACQPPRLKVGTESREYLIVSASGPVPSAHTAHNSSPTPPSIASVITPTSGDVIRLRCQPSLSE